MYRTGLVQAGLGGEQAGLMSEPYANLYCRMINLAVQTVFARGRRGAVGTQPRPEDLWIAPAVLSARAVAPAPGVDRLVRPDEGARFKPLSSSLLLKRMDSDPMPRTVP